MHVLSHSHWGRGGGGGGPLKFSGESSKKKESLQTLDLQRLASLWYSITTQISDFLLRSLLQQVKTIENSKTDIPSHRHSHL